MQTDHAALPAPIRLTILTGFLGAGKTTLLNRILRDPALRDTAVIVNEFGEIGIDHLLVESAGEEIIELADGCVCCTVRGDLVDTLLDLQERSRDGRIRPLSRVVVETTGLADPTPIIASLMAHPLLVKAYALGSVVTVVDAAAGTRGIEGRVEAERQIATADRIVLTKTDLRDDAPDPELLRFVARLNPRAPERADAVAIATLLDGGLRDARTQELDVARWLGDAPSASHHHHGHEGDGHSHGPHVHAFSLVENRPIAEAALRDFLGLLFETAGANLLRMKAVVQTADAPDRPLVLHGVRGYLHPPARLPGWPAGTAPHSRLVLIGEGLNEAYVRDLFAAFTGQPRVDAPDRAALLDNPLAVAGMNFTR